MVQRLPDQQPFWPKSPDSAKAASSMSVPPSSRKGTLNASIHLRGIRQQYGDWYALGPPFVRTAPSPRKQRPNQQPPRPPKEQKSATPHKRTSSFLRNGNKPVPPAKSLVLRPRPHPLKPTTAPSWRHIQPEDLRDPQRRVNLHKDACRIGVIGSKLCRTTQVPCGDCPGPPPRHPQSLWDVAAHRPEHCLPQVYR